MTRTFIDSSVLIAAARGDPDTSPRAFEILVDETRVFVSSDLVRLEVLPKSIWLRISDERDFYDEFFGDSEVVPLSAGLATLAFEEAATHDIGAMDALHVAAAKQSSCAELFTAEKPTKPMFRAQTQDLTISTIHPNES